ncbi:hypothetical protein Vadar_015714 [Vaccinium darrowii]|uniref:Uncharacterized protein n=1 Tax=Vaccinium darrowii TaxID=229202 RepID=A0ACB7XHQ2_9ERIC|nr:hypothetical protein Vadar_015714 [Vaccinium darrowii]
MGNWAQLPEDLLALTAKRMTLFEDFLSFSGVCKSWRSVAINDNFKGTEQIPWLMLSEKDKPDERQFVSLRKGGVIRTINYQKQGENDAWRLWVDYHLKRITKHLSFVHKAVLSSSPEKSDDYVLVVIYGRSGYLAFWRPGDVSWAEVYARTNSFCDIIFHKGLFYGVIGTGMVLAFDVWGPEPTLAWPVLQLPHRYIGQVKQPFLVESAGVVLMVIQDASLPDFRDDDHFVYDNRDTSRVGYRICGFHVFKAFLSKGIWAEITSLGDNALFLGDNASVSFDASRFPGIKANCIYHTEDSWEFYERGGEVKDACIYYLEDGSRSSCYEGESFNSSCPPMWVNPPSF